MADFRVKDPTNTRTVPALTDAFPLDKGSPDTTRRYSEMADVKTAFESGGSAELELSGDQVTDTITEVAHGVDVGAVGHDGVDWVLADATSGGNPCFAFCIEKIDNDNFKVAYSGRFTLTAHGISVGQNYLSTTPGAVSTTQAGPGNIRQRVLVALDANEILLTIGDPLL